MDEINTYIELRYLWPTENNYVSIRKFTKSLPPEVISEILAYPDFGKPILFGKLVAKYKSALIKYHANN